ncbi:putative leader peptide [Actinomadura sp. 3N508]
MESRRREEATGMQNTSGGPRLTVRRHVDLVRVASAVCR